MKKFECAAVAAGALTAAVVGLAAPAAAAPSGVGNAQNTIQNLESQGYHVIISKLGTAPLDQSAVLAIRPGQTYSRTDSGSPGDDLTTTVTGKTVYVEVS